MIADWQGIRGQQHSEAVSGGAQGTCAGADCARTRHCQPAAHTHALAALEGLHSTGASRVGVGHCLHNAGVGHCLTPHSRSCVWLLCSACGTKCLGVPVSTCRPSAPTGRTGRAPQHVHCLGECGAVCALVSVRMGRCCSGLALEGVVIDSSFWSSIARWNTCPLQEAHGGPTCQLPSHILLHLCHLCLLLGPILPLVQCPSCCSSSGPMPCRALIASVA